MQQSLARSGSKWHSTRCSDDGQLRVFRVTESRRTSVRPSIMDRDSDAPYKIYRETEEGQEFFIASRPSVIEAERLVANLNDNWPGEYSIRGPE